MILEFIYNLS